VLSSLAASRWWFVIGFQIGGDDSRGGVGHADPLAAPGSMTDIGHIIDEIKAIPHFPTFACSQCGAECRVHALQIYCRCPKCTTEVKCRSFGGVGTDILDVIDAVLEWAGDGDTFDAVIRRHREIMSDPD